VAGSTGVPATPVQDQGALESFKTRAAEFMQTFNFLKGKEPVIARHPELKSDYTSLMDKGDWVRAAIEKVTSGVDALTGWFRSTFGAASADQLGFVPLIPLAVIAASTAAIAKWMSDAYTFSRRLSAIEKLEAGGMSPQQAADLVAAQEPAGLLNFKLGGAMPVYIIGIGALAYLMWRFRKRS